MEYKFAVLGSSAVGKSCIVVRYIRDSFTETVCLLILVVVMFFCKYDPTIEDAYKKQDEMDGKVRMLDILDTAGMVLFVEIFFFEKILFHFRLSILHYERSIWRRGLDLYLSILLSLSNHFKLLNLLLNKSMKSSKKMWFFFFFILIYFLKKGNYQNSNSHCWK
jgi:hypothetical protein